MQIEIPNLEALPQAARAFAEAIGTRRVFAFYGKMGAGKTTFIKALCDHLGVRDAVASPTFAILNEYADAHERPIYHFDFYRLRRPEEAYDIGFDDYIYSGELCLIEWPELVEPLLPDDTVRVTIDEQPDGTRLLTL